MATLYYRNGRTSESADILDPATRYAAEKFQAWQEANGFGRYLDSDPNWDWDTIGKPASLVWQGLLNEYNVPRGGLSVADQVQLAGFVSAGDLTFDPTTKKYDASPMLATDILLGFGRAISPGVAALIDVASLGSPAAVTTAANIGAQVGRAPAVPQQFVQTPQPAPQTTPGGVSNGSVNTPAAAGQSSQSSTYTSQLPNSSLAPQPPNTATPNASGLPVLNTTVDNATASDGAAWEKFVPIVGAAVVLWFLLRGRMP